MKKRIHMKSILVVTFLALFPFVQCDHIIPYVPAAAKEITFFSLSGHTGLINGTNIGVTVPFGTGVTALIATFGTTGAAVRVGETVQTSGVTANDFTTPLIYSVIAEDLSFKTYLVTVTVAPGTAKDITSYSLAGYPGMITGTAVSVTVPHGTGVTGLVAAFTTTGVTVRVGGTVQESGVTANNFTAPVTYIVTAADATTKNYTVTVTIAPDSAKDITAYSLAGYPGVIDGAAISVAVPFGTAVTGLIAMFSTTGAAVRVGGTVQVSGVTANNFTAPVTYTVTAEDATTKTYVVTVTFTCSGDLYEPNESLPSAFDLGNIPEFDSEIEFTATITPAGDADCFRFRFIEGLHSCFPNTAQYFQVHIRLVPPQGRYCADYEVYLYDASNNLIGHSQTGSCNTEVVDFDFEGRCAQDDSHYFYVRVVGVGGAYGCAGYSLFIDCSSL